jgi:hypothetical protein
MIEQGNTPFKTFTLIKTLRTSSAFDICLGATIHSVPPVQRGGTMYTASGNTMLSAVDSWPTRQPSSEWPAAAPIRELVGALR